MKIIAKTSGGYLVEADEQELAECAGFSSLYADGWEYRRSGIPIGTKIDVRAAGNFHRRILDHQDKARSAAGILRGMAEMLDGVMPDVIVPPVAPAPSAPAAEANGEAAS